MADGSGAKTLDGKLRSLKNLKNIDYDKLQLTPEISTNIIKELMNGKPLTRI